MSILSESEPVKVAPRDDWPPDAVDAVEQLNAAVGQLQERAAQLQHALDSRVVIEQAKGVLAERLDLPPELTFELLRRAARSAQLRLRDLAHDVVRSPATPAPLAREVARLRREERG